MDSNPIAQFFASTDTKFYMALAGGLWTAFKGFNWVRDIRDKDLKGLKDDVTIVSTEVRSQTGAINSGFFNLTGAVHELRNDFRTFYTSPDPMMTPVNSRVTRKRKSVAARKKTKARPAPVAKKQK